MNGPDTKESKLERERESERESESKLERVKEMPRDQMNLPADLSGRNYANTGHSNTN